MGDFWAKSGLKRHSDYGLVLQIALEKVLRPSQPRPNTVSESVGAIYTYSKT